MDIGLLHKEYFISEIDGKKFAKYAKTIRKIELEILDDNTRLVIAPKPGTKFHLQKILQSI